MTMRIAWVAQGYWEDEGNTVELGRCASHRGSLAFMHEGHKSLVAYQKQRDRVLRRD